MLLAYVLSALSQAADWLGLCNFGGISCNNTTLQSWSYYRRPAVVRRLSWPSIRVHVTMLHQVVCKGGGPGVLRPHNNPPPNKRTIMQHATQTIQLVTSIYYWLDLSSLLVW